jgi:hypothetical protein
MVSLRCRVRCRLPASPGNIEVGLEFVSEQHAALARVALWLFTHTARQPAPPPIEGRPAAA